jgi:hypothetical protein
VNGDVAVITAEPTSGRNALRTLFEIGPQRGTHVIGSFNSPARLKEVVSKGIGGGAEVVGAHITVGVSPNEMNSFTPSASMQVGDKDETGRENRARFYDRNSGKQPRMVVPYQGPPGVEPVDED